MRSVRCRGGRLRGGADQPAGPRCLMQARALEHQAPRPSRACPCHQNATTDKSGTKSHTWGAGRGTARHLWIGSTFPVCTVWQAATTGGVPAKCYVQPTLPCAPTTCFHMINDNLAGSDDPIASATLPRVLFTSLPRPPPKAMQARAAPPCACPLSGSRGLQGSWRTGHQSSLVGRLQLPQCICP